MPRTAYEGGSLACSWRFFHIEDVIFSLLNGLMVHDLLGYKPSLGSADR